MPDDLVMVVLRELERPRGVVLEATEARQAFPERLQLERELSTTRQQLDVTLNEYEMSIQELRGTNEELLSTNEELQSANEELETSREELQSVNEELETANAKLNENNARLRRVNSDLKNLFESTQIAALFLDDQLCVRGFTPIATRFFGVRDRDMGRPVRELAWRFVYGELDEDAAEVRKSLQVVEREVTIPATDEVLIMRMRPYRTVDDRIDGFVLTFFDITARKRTEDELERQRRNLERQYDELQTLYDTAPVGLSLMDRDLRWLRINERLAAINGFPIMAHIGKRQDELIPNIDENVKRTQLRVFAKGEPILGTEVSGVTPAAPDRLRHWIADYYPVRTGGEIFAIGCCVREVTEQVELERELTASLSRLKLAVSRHPISMHEVDADGRLIWTLGDRPGFPTESDVGRPFLETVPEPIQEQLSGPIGSVRRSGRADRCDISQPERRETFDVSLEPTADGGVMLLWIDVSERKDAEDRKALLLGELQHRVKNTLATTLSMVRFAADTASSVDDMAEAVSDRLLAISRTHDLLTSSAWTDVSAADIVAAELAPYQQEKMDIATDGLSMALTPRIALALSLAIHELTTNSAKHGALAEPGGSLEVTLAEATSDTLRLSWRESAGRSPSAASDRSGFGRFLLETALPYQVDGTSELFIDETGVRFDLTFPRGRVGPPSPTEPEA